jgi:hypothetical protein
VEAIVTAGREPGVIAARAVSGVRAAWEVVQAASPEAAVRLACGRVPMPPPVLVRLLGARELAQAVLLARWPTRTVARTSAGLDLVHALSMLAAAVVWPGHRRVALTSAALAGASAVATAGVP